MSRPEEKSNAGLLEYAATLLALMGLCLAAAAGFLAVDLSRLEHRYHDAADSANTHLSQRIGSLDTVLSGLIDLQLASSQFRESEFQTLARRTLSSHPYINAIARIDRVGRTEKEAHEAMRKARGFPSYEVWEKDTGGKQKIAADRDFYLPIDLITPLDPEFASLLGYDIASDRAIQNAIEEAVESGRSVASLPLELGQQERGYLLLKAGYRGYEIPASPESRREQFNGLIALHLEAKEFLGGIIGELEGGDYTFRYEPLGAGNPAGVFLSGSSAPPPDWLRHIISPFEFHETFVGHGTPFVLEIRFQPLVRDFRLWLLAVAIAAAAIVGIALLVSLRNRLNTKRALQTQEAELAKSEARFRDFADASSDWFWEMDQNLRFSYFSERYTELTGVPPGGDARQDPRRNRDT